MMNVLNWNIGQIFEVGGDLVNKVAQQVPSADVTQVTATTPSLLGMIDWIIMICFIVGVIVVGLWKSEGGGETHGDKGSQNYFLAGRSLPWWLIGISLIAANISTEQFVGMTGSAANKIGMAIASYEWLGAITLVMVAFFFIPKFLKSGVYTIPGYLEYRYDFSARLIMALFCMLTLVLVNTPAVIYSSAKFISVYFKGTELFGQDLGNMTFCCILIGVISAVYVVFGGLKACAWADLFQGIALIIGGLIITYFVANALSGATGSDLVQNAANPNVTADQINASTSWLDRLWSLNDADLPEGKLHMVRPKDDPTIPGPALLIGLWIPNFFYFGLNQYIIQRVLGSKSVAEGQRGIVFAAGLKLIIPFIVVIPGILAFNVLNDKLQNEAERKSNEVIAKIETIDKVVPFDAQYAMLSPENVNLILSHNAKILKKDSVDILAQAVKCTTELKEIDATYVKLPDEEQKSTFAKREQIGQTLVALNKPMVDLANKSSNKPTEMLIGYDYDAAFPSLLALIPVGKGLMGFVIAAMCGAIISSLAAMLNAASTIFTMDLYRVAKKDASEFTLVSAGRVSLMCFAIIGICIAPFLANPKFSGIFNFIQEFQGFISPGILAVFIFALFVKQVPRYGGLIGLIAGPIVYWLLMILPFTKDMAYLNRMSITFGACCALLAFLTMFFPRKEEEEKKSEVDIPLESSSGAMVLGIVVIVATLVLYSIFF